MAKNNDDEHDIDEVFTPEMDPEAGIKEVLRDAGTEDHELEAEPDVISDPGVEGGVDEPNESTD
ncbi:MAG TPA: hypothetical protein VMF33_02840 [Acidimicrobiales bacterium]|nr:hypothetical protein [Acidimicrobiales bacterium]